MSPVLTIRRLFVTPNSVVWYATKGGTSIRMPTSRTTTLPPAARPEDDEEHDADDQQQDGSREDEPVERCPVDDVLVWRSVSSM